MGRRWQLCMQSVMCAQLLCSYFQRGQHLEPFLESFLKSTESLKPIPRLVWRHVPCMFMSFNANYTKSNDVPLSFLTLQNKTKYAASIGIVMTSYRRITVCFCLHSRLLDQESDTISISSEKVGELPTFTARAITIPCPPYVKLISALRLKAPFVTT